MIQPIQIEVTNKSGEFKKFNLLDSLESEDFIVKNTKSGQDIYSVLSGVNLNHKTVLIRIQKLKGDLCFKEFRRLKFEVNNKVYIFGDYMPPLKSGIEQCIVDIPIVISLKGDDYYFLIPPNTTLIYTYFNKQK